ncbi:carboxylesterase family protein [Fibrobacter sp.]|uniref:carboxylesterase family protein n=1 Tax=Fibrobacter sp. TaxID=35828 RepID=UPI0025C434DD|nr:carboxylesterase family protein [Fibrobacter sp.]MBS7272924.1 carboxylesterase family protein [Fibrobacter sp.]MCI6437057.1 carboxylesterase family protein [Fibrobacter sp.]
MKKIALLLACSIAFADAGERYKDRMFDVSVERDVVYASGVKHLKKLNTISLGLLTYAIMNDGMPVYLYENETDLASVNLHMDIYKPKNDSVKKRPAVLVMHGGAFAAGPKNDYDQHSITYCD